LHAEVYDIGLIIRYKVFPYDLSFSHNTSATDKRQADGRRRRRRTKTVPSTLDRYLNQSAKMLLYYYLKFRALGRSVSSTQGGNVFAGFCPFVFLSVVLLKALWTDLDTSLLQYWT